MFQWRDGDRAMRDRPDLEGAVQAVTDELNRRLGSTFELQELVVLYGEGTDWAEEIASQRYAGEYTVAVVDAAFARYCRQAADFAGGRRYVRD
jgi:hypothetical protein